MRIKGEQLLVGYDDHTVLDHLDVDIPEGQITAIIGPNGCGKSTLLKGLTRILSPDSGQVLLDGEDIEKQKTKDVAKKMAILPQSNDYANGLTVGELVSYGRFPYQKGFGRLSEEDVEVIHQAMESTGVETYKHRPVDELSGGQQQRVWIAMALAQDTDMIFLDEPTTYLDLAHQLEVLELLQNLNQLEGRTIVMVLHDLNHAARFADYIISMREGSIIKEGRYDDVMQDDVLRRVFDIDAVVGQDPRTGRPICLTYNLIKGEKDNDNKAVNSFTDDRHAYAN
ncbi:ABC transporter ATP-binding protein [Alkalibacillus salilacus]|uniref:Iron complex transport system ATP-binding protein n=1 Tax=Alkalibacillus salilacus TaxID=284582 RepID=A0ABT9VAW4_9BACI|nr:ABC transporter ATP-binding protein [Alkalibacillus salilacus]MDQ0158110.1 iron complex transport system ATP-binding protein [Alkalibacillus salilacus]